MIRGRSTTSTSGRATWTVAVEPVWGTHLSALRGENGVLERWRWNAYRPSWMFGAAGQSVYGWAITRGSAHRQALRAVRRETRRHQRWERLESLAITEQHDAPVGRAGMGERE